MMDITEQTSDDKDTVPPQSLRKKFPKEYKAWSNIKWRCHCEKGRDYWKYGQRGITVFEGWRTSFKCFLRDVGQAPTREHSLERIDNHKPYEPGNVKWATIKEQNCNRRNSLFIEYQNVKIYFADFCREFGLKYESARRKLGRGWTAEDLINKAGN